METLFIVIPAYNEEANIHQVIGDWYPVIEKYSGNGRSRLVIIDDGSKDATYRIICECAKTRPLLTPLTKKKRRTRICGSYRISVCSGTGSGLYFPNGFRWADAAGRVRAFLAAEAAV